MPDKIHEQRCNQCGSEVSGPNLASVKEHMARHKAKKHPKPVKITKAVTHDNHD